MPKKNLETILAITRWRDGMMDSLQAKLATATNGKRRICMIAEFERYVFLRNAKRREHAIFMEKWNVHQKHRKCEFLKLAPKEATDIFSNGYSNYFNLSGYRIKLVDQQSRILLIIYRLPTEQQIKLVDLNELECAMGRDAALAEEFQYTHSTFSDGKSMASVVHSALKAVAQLRDEYALLLADKQKMLDGKTQTVA